MKPVNLEEWRAAFRAELEAVFRKYGLDPNAPDFMATLVKTLTPEPAQEPESKSPNKLNWS
jgi:hypothetical protein